MTKILDAQVFNLNAPVRDQFVIRADRGEDQRIVVMIAASFAAKRFVEAILEYAGEILEATDTTILATRGVTLSSPRLEEIRNTFLTPEHKSWRMHPTLQAELNKLFAEATDRKFDDPRADLVSLHDIADGFGTSHRKLAEILRGLGIKRPALGWYWPEGRAEAITKLLAQELSARANRKRNVQRKV